MTKIAQYIRPIALGILIKDGKILTVREFDRKKMKFFTDCSAAELNLAKRERML